MTSKRKQDWEVTVMLVETEGDDQSTTKPWYDGNDVRDLVRVHLAKSGIMRDLKVRSVVASEAGDRYFDEPLDTVQF